MKTRTSTVTVAAVILDQAWKKDGTNHYRIRLIKGGRCAYVKTNVIVRRASLSASGKLKDASVRYRLEQVVRETEEAVASLDTYALEAMTLAEVVEYVKAYGDGEFRLDFLKFAREAALAKEGTSRATYLCAVRSLEAFVGLASMDVSRLTSSLMRRWENWLRDRYGDRARVVSAYPACIAYLHGRARGLYNDEEAGVVRIRNPFLYYKPPRQRKAEHRAATLETVQKMILDRCSLGGRERLGVDVFLISFALWGMNAPDLYNCRAAEDGVLRYNRQKTASRREDGAPMAVRIEDCVLPILAPYRSRDPRFAFSFRERYTSYQIFGSNVNAGLKKYCERNGLEPMTLYWARHTFSTEAYRAGIDKGVINDCLCHVDRAMSVTDVYIERDWTVLWAANRKLLARLKW